MFNLQTFDNEINKYLSTSNPFTSLKPLVIQIFFLAFSEISSF